MNATSQLDRHPEAESLNAFVEHALPEPEHRQIASHLAGCTRCRQIVYLAQDAAASEPAPAVIPFAPERKANKLSWFPAWRPIWTVAAVCTILLTVVVILQLRRTPSTPQIAEASHPANPATQHPADTESNPKPEAKPEAKPNSKIQTQIPESAAKSQAGRSNAPNLPLQPIVSGAASGLPPAPQDSAKQDRAKQDEARQAQAKSASAGTLTPDVSHSGIVSVAKAGASHPNQIAQPAQTGQTAHSAQPAQPAQSSQSEPAAPPQTGNGETPAVATNAAATSFPNAYNPAPTQPSRTAARGFVPPKFARMPRSAIAPTSGAAIQPQHSQSQPIAGMKMRVPAITDAEAARNVLYTRLPNGLIAASTAAVEHHLLAVDSAGSLFLSEDQGATWQPIPRQWTGRALEVRVAPTLNPTAKSAESQPQAAPCPTCPALPHPLSNPAFEILTDSPATWTSLDGKQWKPK